MKKLMSVFALIVVLSLALSACGGAAPATEAPAAVEPAAEETAAPVEPTVAPVDSAPAATLKIWADDTRTPILLAFADDFKAKYNVELIVEDLGRVQDIR